MKCLICDRPLKHAQQSECECGESLAFWTTQLTSSQALRQRGLAQVAAGNYAALALSFLEASLANPVDQKNLIDAAKALAHGGCYKEARQLLENADARYNEPKIQVLQTIRKLEELAKRPLKEKPAPPATPVSATPVSATPVSATPVSATPVSATPPPAKPVPAHAPTPTEPAKARQPLLGFGILKHSKSSRRSWRWGREGYFPAIWAIVLHMEGSSQLDWQVIMRWVRAAQESVKLLDVSDGEKAIFPYMLGLAHVQADEHEAAIGAFQGCLKLKPPVFNPALYYLYLNLYDLEHAQSAFEGLKKHYHCSEQDDCWDRLQEFLAARGVQDKLDLLRQVLHRKT